MTIRANIAIVGAGIGGLALAGLLSRRGFRVHVYEQAKGFQRIGAGIQMSPNAMRALAALGLEPYLKRIGVTLCFADGSRASADAVVGADGVHSKVREFLLGAEKPRFTGRVAHPTVFPTVQMGDFALDTHQVVGTGQAHRHVSRDRHAR